MPSESRFARIAAIARGSESTKTAVLAPLDRASRPRAPEPAKRSRTRAWSRSPRIEKSASRTRSEVGRVPRPRGALRRRPPRGPATILKCGVWGCGGGGGGTGLCRLSTVDCSLRRNRLQLRPEGRGRRHTQQRVLRLAQIGVALQQLVRPVAGQLQQRQVLRDPRHLEDRQAVLAGAQDLALAAELQVDLGELEAVA